MLSWVPIKFGVFMSDNLIWCYQECQSNSMVSGMLIQFYIIRNANFILYYQERQLHAPGPLHQVLPQQRTHPCSSQPLPQGLHRSSLLIDEDAQRTWPPSTLQAKLWTQTDFSNASILQERLCQPNPEDMQGKIWNLHWERHNRLEMEEEGGGKLGRGLL